MGSEEVSLVNRASWRRREEIARMTCRTRESETANAY